MSRLAVHARNGGRSHKLQVRLLVRLSPLVPCRRSARCAVAALFCASCASSSARRACSDGTSAIFVPRSLSRPRVHLPDAAMLLLQVLAAGTSLSALRSAALQGPLPRSVLWERNMRGLPCRRAFADAQRSAASFDGRCSFGGGGDGSSTLTRGSRRAAASFSVSAALHALLSLA